MVRGTSAASTTVDNLADFDCARIRHQCWAGSGSGGRPSRGCGRVRPSSDERTNVSTMRRYWRSAPGRMTYIASGWLWTRRWHARRSSTSSGERRTARGDKGVKFGSTAGVYVIDSNLPRRSRAGPFWNRSELGGLMGVRLTGKLGCSADGRVGRGINNAQVGRDWMQRQSALGSFCCSRRRHSIRFNSFVGSGSGRTVGRVTCVTGACCCCRGWVVMLGRSVAVTTEWVLFAIGE